MTTPIISEDLCRILRSPLVDHARLRGRRVAVTGAGGMLPSYLALALLELNRHENAGVEVLALGRHEATLRRALGDYTDRDGLRLVEADVTRPLPDLGRVDYMVHAASGASPRDYASDPVGVWQANTLGTHHTLQSALAAGAQRYLFFSSGEVYGQPTTPDKPLRESDMGWLDPTNPRNCYAESKRAGETLCASVTRQMGLATVCARVFHTYGPTMRLRDGRSFSDFCADALEGRDIELRSDGQARRPFCYLADATVAYLALLLDGAPGEAYNVGNPQGERSVRQIAESVARHAPRPCHVTYATPTEAAYTAMRSPVPGIVPDVSKLTGLGWQPTTTPEEGFQRTMESLLFARINERGGVNDDIVARRVARRVAHANPPRRRRGGKGRGTLFVIDPFTRPLEGRAA